jgi:acyl-CoA hydrolase
MQEMKKDAITFRFLTEPSDVNFGGKVHGGAVMKWIDQVGYTCAVNWSNGYCVTAYVGGIRFLRPIFIGHIAELHARIIYTGTSSMHIAINIQSINPKTQTADHTTSCIIIMVAVDDEGKSRPVTQWLPTTEEDIRLNNYAKELILKRKEIADVMDKFYINP